jgi:hypothetical protein
MVMRKLLLNKVKTETKNWVRNERMPSAPMHRMCGWVFGFQEPGPQRRAACLLDSNWRQDAMAPAFAARLTEF